MSGIPRSEYIEKVMARQGITKHARKYIVLQQWDTIIDHDVTYTLQVPAVPNKLERGATVYVISKPDSPDLESAHVIEDLGDSGVFVEPVRDPPVGIQFLVPRDAVKMLPIPLRPFAIHRADLRLYIGDEAARAWHDQRRNRRDQERAT